MESYHLNAIIDHLGYYLIKQFRVLVTDDEDRIVTFIKSKLKASGYDVLTASNGLEALEQIRTHDPDLVVLDIVMPKKDGVETLKEIREFSTVPVIMLSAKAADTDKIDGLTHGADDYLAKPFNPDELVARIEAIRRRSQSDGRHKTSELLVLGDISIDLDKCSVSVKGNEVKLTRIEWLLLKELASNAGRLMPYEELLTRIWGFEYRDDIHTLRSWISRLRNKLGTGSSEEGLISTKSG